MRRSWWLLAIFVAVAEAVLLSAWWNSFPYVSITAETRDIAVEMRKVVIELDGVLIGFAGLIGTMIFTRPIGKGDKKKSLLQLTLAMVLLSVGCFVVSAFLAIHSLSEISLQSALLAGDFWWFGESAFFVVAGIDALGLLIFFGMRLMRGNKTPED